MSEGDDDDDEFWVDYSNIYSRLMIQCEAVYSSDMLNPRGSARWRRLGWDLKEVWILSVLILVLD
jgi:hypothetical protein